MLIIERVEGEIVVVEDGERHITVAENKIKGKFREGDILVPNDGGYYTVDPAATSRRRAEIIKLQNDLWE